ERINAEQRLADSHIALGDAAAYGKSPEEARTHYNEAWSLFDKLHLPSLRAKVGLSKLERLYPEPIRAIPVKGLHTALVRGGKRAFSLGQRHGVEVLDILDLTAGVVTRSVPLKIDGLGVMIVAASPDGRLVAFGSHLG